jgi:hypothetical protein
VHRRPRYLYVFGREELCNKTWLLGGAGAEVLSLLLAAVVYLILSVVFANFQPFQIVTGSFF